MTGRQFEKKDQRDSTSSELKLQLNNLVTKGSARAGVTGVCTRRT